MADDFDPVASSVPFGPSGETAPSDTPATDPLARSVPLGVLSTSYDKVPSNDHGPGVISDVGRGLGLGTRNAVEGMTSLPAAAVDAMTWPGRWLGNTFGDPNTPRIEAPSTMLDRGVTALGVPEARTPEEKRNAEIIRGGSAMLTPMGVGTAAPGFVARAPTLVRPIIGSAPVTSAPLAATQVVAGGAGAGAGEAAASSPFVPDWAKPAARLTGNIIGAGGVSALSDAAGILRTMYEGVKTPVAEALDRLLIRPRTMGAVTDRPEVQRAEATYSGTGSNLQPAQQGMVDDFGRAVDDTAHLLSPPGQPPIRTMQDAGTVAQNEAYNWIKNTFPAKQQAVWNPLNQRMAGASVDPAPYRKALEYAASPPALASLPENQRAFASAQARKWLDALNTDVPPGQTLTWEQAQALKSQIGDAMGTTDITGNMSASQLKGIYGGLAEGMKDTANQHGQGGLFNAANQVTIDGHQFIDGTLSRIIQRNNQGQEIMRPDDVARTLLRDNTAQQQLRDQLPAAADAIAAAKLRDMQTAKPSQQGDVSTGTFLTNARAQMRDDPEGTRALFSDPLVSQKLDDLVTVADQLRSVEKNMNTSKTAPTSRLMEMAPRAIMAATMGGPKAGAGMLGADVLWPSLVRRGLTSPLGIKVASTPSGPRLPIENPRVAGLLGFLATQR